MKRNWLLLLLLTLPILIAAQTKFYFGLKEITLLCPDIQGFKVDNTEDHYSYWDSDDVGEVEITGNAGVGIALNPGFAFDTSFSRVNVSASAGYMFFAAFGSGVFGGEIEVLKKKGQRFLFGPRASLIFYSPSWIVDGDVSLEADNPGYEVGFAIYGSFSKVDFGGSLGYQYGYFHVETDNGWVANRDHLNISGVVLQLGIKFK